jgi:hypothetical protein
MKINECIKYTYKLNKYIITQIIINQELKLEIIQGNLEDRHKGA